MACAFHGTLTQAQLPSPTAMRQGSCASFTGALPGSYRDVGATSPPPQRRFRTKAALLFMPHSVALAIAAPKSQPAITSPG